MQRFSRYGSFYRRFLLAFSGFPLVSCALAGSICATISISERVEAHGCSDGSVLVGAWESARVRGDGWWQFSWQLTVPPGQGHTYEWDLVSRKRDPYSGTWGAWQTNNGPVRMPTGSYFIWAFQTQVRADMEVACRVDCFLTGMHEIFATKDGFAYAVDMTWLFGDVDGDSITNLWDDDHLVTCTGDIFSSSGCTQPFEGLQADELGGVYDPPEATGVPSMPVTAGGWEVEYACDDNMATGGATMPEFSTDPLQRWNEYVKWAQKYWKTPEFYGLPADPKPYEGAYNLVRGGAGGGESAYFSAVWGKRVTYMLAGTPANFQAGVRLGASTYWHRYVVMPTGLVSFQYYHPGSACWKKLGVCWSGENVANPVVSEVPWNTAVRLIPEGYRAGDVVGETGSNVPGGQYRLPAYAGSINYQSHLSDMAGTGSGVGSGGAGLSSSDLETAFGNALRAAGVGGEGGGDGISGEGAWTSAGSVFGMVGVGDGGVSTGIEEGMGEAQEDFGGGLMEVMGLGDIAPAANVAGVFTINLPKPGGGTYDVTLSTLPDTSTPGGLALDGIRQLLRSAILVWWTWKLCLSCIHMYREIT